MMQKCRDCQASIPTSVVNLGRLVDLRGRQRCLDCLPHRPLRAPRKPVKRPVLLKRCAKCGQEFAARIVIDGKLRMLYRRRFCFDCSPFGSHNTSRQPPGIADPAQLHTYRRSRKNAVTYRSLKSRRKRRKLELIESRGGRCEGCGYNASVAALEFHHRDPSTKEFGLGSFQGTWERLLEEAAKCDLLCANCHRTRHALLDAGRGGHPVVEHRRRRKLRAIEYMGQGCSGCGRDGVPGIFEFHHWNAAEKEFGISNTGIPRSWEKVVAELAKCVMLCANCHREVHAGVRELFDDDPLGLAEDAPPYRYATTVRSVAVAVA